MRRRCTAARTTRATPTRCDGHVGRRPAACCIRGLWTRTRISRRTYRVRELDILHDQGRCVCQPCAPAAARDSDRREDVQKYPHTHIIFARAAQSILVSQVLVHLLWSWVLWPRQAGVPIIFLTNMKCDIPPVFLMPRLLLLYPIARSSAHRWLPGCHLGQSFWQ